MVVVLLHVAGLSLLRVNFFLLCGESDFDSKGMGKCRQGFSGGGGKSCSSCACEQHVSDLPWPFFLGLKLKFYVMTCLCHLLGVDKRVFENKNSDNFFFLQQNCLHRNSLSSLLETKFWGGGGNKPRNIVLFLCVFNSFSQNSTGTTLCLMVQELQRWWLCFAPLLTLTLSWAGDVLERR